MGDTRFQHTFEEIILNQFGNTPESKNIIIQRSCLLLSLIIIVIYKYSFKNRYVDFLLTYFDQINW